MTIEEAINILLNEVILDCSNRGAIAILTAYNAIRAQQEAGENESLTWISVKDRLPETGINVLILDKWDHIHICELRQYLNGKMYFNPWGMEPGRGDVTHWMPLPEPPKEKKMKKYTQEEFDRLPVEDGVKICPEGDYSDIKSFCERCSFGAGCRFGECCRFGKGCICEFGEFYHMTAHGGYGSEDRTTYFFGLTDGRICVRCGCFAGTIAEWEAKVKETHGDSYLARAYLALIQPVQIMMEGKRNEADFI